MAMKQLTGDALTGDALDHDADAVDAGDTDTDTDSHKVSDTEDIKPLLDGQD